ncbi:MAG: hypothetical protein E7508_01665 [Ruminococcus sp.]|nr:hypothetical protein [Ruminococcus sp.]
MENNIFPLPIKMHIIFVCIAVLLFIFRYVTVKRTYQLLMGAAVAASLLLYINTGRIWYYSVGVIELILILGSLVSVIMDRKKNKPEKTDEAAEQ